MTDIDMAIAYYEEIANNFEEYKRIHCITEYQYKKGSQSGQLAEWLKELKQYREWLKSFNPDSATECFTAVRQLRSVVNKPIAWMSLPKQYKESEKNDTSHDAIQPVELNKMALKIESDLWEHC